MAESPTAESTDIVRVAVAAPLDRALSYRVPPALREQVKVGSRLSVPLGRRSAVGFVLGRNSTVDAPERLKDIREVLDAAPLFGPAHAAFYERAAHYYGYPVGEAVRTALPAGLAGRSAAPPILQERVYAPGDCGDEPRGKRQKEILQAVRAAGTLTLTELRARFAAPHAVLQRLVEYGALQVSQVERRRDPFQEVQVEADAPPARLTTSQQAALETVRAALESPRFAPILLHGVTGSGKTEVYLQAIGRLLELGRQALVLVPEIALTPQLVRRFRARFHDGLTRFAILHSGLSDGERYDAWRAVAAGEVDIVIGARSAIFAPLPNLGIIVVDEEHDGSYKQSEGFRYNARDLALLRGQMEQAVVLLGSATPALGTYQRAISGQTAYLPLPERAGRHPLPAVGLVDLGAAEEGKTLAPELVEALARTLQAGEQALLLLNRRGYAPFLLCHDCGATCRCPNCEITLTFSRAQHSLRCHYCDYRLPPPASCARCGGPAVMPEGVGTERLEEELQTLFPAARVARMDRDTTTRKGAHARLVDQMMGGEIDILVGTQMIAKGHDFPQVTLVGVLNADSALNLPDFRSAERVFALLSQVAGRAGRGEQPGRVLIQTYDPEHPVFELTCRHDYRAFAAMELAQREALGYPPYGYLVNLVLAGNDPDKVARAAETLAAQLAGEARDVEVLGPAPCLLSRLRGKQRVQILLKAARRNALRRLVDPLSAGHYRMPPGVALTVDVDPVDMY